MQLVRVAFPAVIGGLFLLLGSQPVLSGFQQGDNGAVVGGVRAGLIPIGIGVALLLDALAISSRTRLGWLLGQAVAVLMAIGGLVIIVAGIPYLDDGGLGAAFAGPFMVIAGFWSLAWVVYGQRLRKGRAAFAPNWQLHDRRLGIVVATLVVLVGAGWFSLGAMQGQGAGEVESRLARAQALVAATTLGASVVDHAIDQPSDAGSDREVARLSIELTLASAEYYALLEWPTLCLTDTATFQDPAYKPDRICWGTSGRALVLASDFPNMTVTAGTTTIRVELARAGSPCAFGAGPWTAALTLAPQVDELATGADLPTPERLTLSARFLVGPDGVAPPPNGTVPVGVACLGVSP